MTKRSKRLPRPWNGFLWKRSSIHWTLAEIVWSSTAGLSLIVFSRWNCVVRNKNFSRQHQDLSGKERLSFSVESRELDFNTSNVMDSVSSGSLSLEPNLWALPSPRILGRSFWSEVEGSWISVPVTVMDSVSSGSLGTKSLSSPLLQDGWSFCERGWGKLDFSTSNRNAFRV